MLRVLMVLLWAHPLFWLARRRVRLDQEMMADAAAAELTGRSAYAEQLVGWARSLNSSPPKLAGAVGLWETRSQLRSRIAVLLDEKLTILRNCSRRWKLSAVAFCATAAVGLSLLTVQPASLAEESTDAKTESQAAFDEALAADPAEPPAASDDLSIGGQVVDQTGKPIAGAEVGLTVLMVNNQDDIERVFREGFEATAFANEEGKFAIPYDEELREGFGNVWAQAPGYSPSRGRSTTVVPALDKRDNLKLVLTKAESTELLVVDVDGKPAAGIKVAVERLRLPQSIGWPVPKEWRANLSSVSDGVGASTHSICAARLGRSVGVKFARDWPGSI